jgi:transposase
VAFASLAAYQSPVTARRSVGRAAVLSGLTLPYSSGAVEGKVGKIKFWKRLMFGRANLDLIRKMALWN